MELSFKMFDSDSIFLKFYIQGYVEPLHVQLSMHAKLFAVCAIFRWRHFGTNWVQMVQIMPVLCPATIWRMREVVVNAENY